MFDFLSNAYKYINDNQLLAGAILGWFIARVGEEVRKPNIKIFIGDEAYLPVGTQPTHKFLHVKVINSKRNLLSSIFLGNPTANNARAWVSFHDYVTAAEIFKMNGRWTSKKEPVNYATNNVDLGEALITPREIIPPGEETSISIVVKEKGNQEIHGFNNESYLHNWKNPDYELDEKRYRVKIKISSEGKEWIEEFLLLNPAKSIKTLKLTKAP